jgi:DNA-binding MarR family transcriptional regulator
MVCEALPLNRTKTIEILNLYNYFQEFCGCVFSRCKRFSAYGLQARKFCLKMKIVVKSRKSALFPAHLPVDDSRDNEYIAGMGGRLKAEIKQTKPFASLELEALLNLERTADLMMRKATEVLKTVDLSPTQYNVLRILKGAGPDGLACREIGERMVTKDPDITRLLDRMEERGLVMRARDSKDRRVVTSRITAKGAKLAEEMEQPLLKLHAQMIGHLGEKKLQTLVDLLELVREGAK